MSVIGEERKTYAQLEVFRFGPEADIGRIFPQCPARPFQERLFQLTVKYLPMFSADQKPPSLSRPKEMSARLCLQARRGRECPSLSESPSSSCVLVPGQLPALHNLPTRRLLTNQRSIRARPYALAALLLCSWPSTSHAAVGSELDTARSH